MFSNCRRHARQFTNLASNLSSESLNQKLSLWMAKYEEFVGLTEVKAAQSRVLEAENKFIKSQEARRETHRQITFVQQRLRELHEELDRVSRGEDKYLALITQEHAVIKDERKLRELFQDFEKEEREHFSALSHAVRDSHEKERAQAEKTKYWSIIGSILGTILGIAGTSINNRLRMKELRELVQDATKTNHPASTSEDLVASISSVIASQTNSNPNIQSQQLQEIPEHQWKVLMDSVSQVTEDIKHNHQVYLQKNQQLEALFLSGRENTIDVDKEFSRQLVMPEKELLSVLNHQRDEIARLVMIGSIIIPITTWALLKFVNM